MSEKADEIVKQFYKVRTFSSRPGSRNSRSISSLLTRDFFQDLRKDLILHTTTPMGNCLFEALACALGLDREDHLKVREDIVGYISSSDETFNKFKPLLFDAQGNEFADRHHYLQTVSLEGEFGSLGEIHAFVEIHNIPIIVYSSVGFPYIRLPENFPFLQNTEKVRFLRQKGSAITGHFDYLAFPEVGEIPRNKQYCRKIQTTTK